MRYFLLGYMGSGKSTLGKALSQDLGVNFVDLDELITGHWEVYSFFYGR